MTNRERRAVEKLIENFKTACVTAEKALEALERCLQGEPISETDRESVVASIPRTRTALKEIQTDLGHIRGVIT